MTIYRRRVSFDSVNHRESQQNNPRATFGWCCSEVFSLTLIKILPAGIVLIIKLQHVTRMHITMAQLHECRLELELSWQWPTCILATGLIEFQDVKICPFTISFCIYWVCWSHRYNNNNNDNNNSNNNNNNNNISFTNWWNRLQFQGTRALLKYCNCCVTKVYWYYFLVLLWFWFKVNPITFVLYNGTIQFYVERDWKLTRLSAIISPNLAKFVKLYKSNTAFLHEMVIAFSPIYSSGVTYVISLFNLMTVIRVTFRSNNYSMNL